MQHERTTHVTGLCLCGLRARVRVSRSVCLPSWFSSISGFPDSLLSVFCIGWFSRVIEWILGKQGHFSASKPAPVLIYTTSHCCDVMIILSVRSNMEIPRWTGFPVKVSDINTVADTTAKLPPNNQSKFSFRQQGKKKKQETRSTTLQNSPNSKDFYLVYVCLDRGWFRIKVVHGSPQSGHSPTC